MASQQWPTQEVQFLIYSWMDCYIPPNNCVAVECDLNNSHICREEVEEGGREGNKYTIHVQVVQWAYRHSLSFATVYPSMCCPITSIISYVLVLRTCTLCYVYIHMYINCVTYLYIVLKGGEREEEKEGETEEVKEGRREGSRKQRCVLYLKCSLQLDTLNTPILEIVCCFAAWTGPPGTSYYPVSWGCLGSKVVHGQNVKNRDVLPKLTANYLLM